MDWVTTTEDRSQTAASIKNAYEIVRQKPQKLTQRLSKLAEKRSSRRTGADDEEQEDEEQQDSAADLAAFPALSKQEGVEARRARVQAYQHMAKVLKGKYTAFCESFDNEVFEKLWHEFVALQDPSKALSPQAGFPDAPAGPAQRVLGLPAAILSARGIGSEADQGGMYPRLLKYLQGRKAYAALLQAKDLSGGVNTALHCMLQQFMGPGTEDWGADDIQALHAWYADQTGLPAAVAATPAAPPVATGLEQQGGGDAGASRDAGAAEPDKEKEKEKEKRQLRQRKPAAGKGKSAAPAAAAIDLFGPQKKANRQRPLVIVIQGTEQAEVSTLRSLTKLLLQDYARLPVCLLLGTSTPADVLVSNLSVDVCSRLCLRPFQMPPQDQRMQGLFQDVLLDVEFGNVLPMALAGPPVELLLQRYSETDGSVHNLVEALELAAFEHCRGEPLAALAAAAMTGSDADALSAAVAALPQDLVAQAAGRVARMSGTDAAVPLAPKTASNTALGKARRRAPGAGTGVDPDEAVGPVSAHARSVAAAVSQAASAWACWRLGLLWTYKVACTTGASRRPEFHLPALYAAAATPTFLPTPSPAPGPRSTQPPAPAPASASGAPPPLPPPGVVLLNRLTVAGGSVSVRALSSDVDQASLRCLLDDLLQLGEEAAEAWPQASHLQCVVSELRSLLQDGREGTADMDVQQGRPSPPRQAGQNPTTATDGSSLFSPVRQALQGVRIKSPGTSADAATAAAAAGSGLAAWQAEGVEALGGVGAAAGNAAAAGGVTGAGVVPRGAAGQGAAAGGRQVLAFTNAGRREARRANLLGAGQPGAAGNPSLLAPLGAGAGGAPGPRSLPERAADFLRDALRQLLGSCPFRLPGSCAFSYSRTWELEGMLTFAPRAAVHEALLRPHVFLGGEEQDFGGGPGAPGEAGGAGGQLMEDAALAYRLLLGQDVVDVGQWFEEFSTEVVGQAHRGLRGAGAGGEEGGEQLGGGSGDEGAAGVRGRGRGGARGRRRGRRLSPEDEGRGRAEARKKVPALKDAPGPLDLLSPQEAEAAALAAAARFSQAVAELQLVGVCRPAKRRKGAAIQRCYYPPETLLAGG